MDEKETIVFRLPKSLWNKCLDNRDRSNILPSNVKSVSSSNSHTSLKHYDSKDSSKNNQMDSTLASTSIQFKKGKKRRAVEKLQPEMILSFANRIINELLGPVVYDKVPCCEYESEASAIGNLSYVNLAKHIIMLRVEFVQRLMRPILQKLMFHPKNSDIFNHPVDPEALNLYDYFSKIKHPMDLRTVKAKILEGIYQNTQDCVNDISLVFQNAILYNPPNHIVNDCARILLHEFNEDISQLNEKLAKEEEKKLAHSCQLCSGSSCALCNDKCLKFEPPILVCSGVCGQRIKRGCIYFMSSDGNMMWCQKCYSSANQVIVEAVGHLAKPILKKDLLKRRFDEEVAEPWVQCAICSRWVHQICALFNDRYHVDKQNSFTYECPLCKIETLYGTHGDSVNVCNSNLKSPKTTHMSTRLHVATPSIIPSALPKKTIASSVPLVVKPPQKKRGRKKKYPEVINSVPFHENKITVENERISVVASNSHVDEVRDTVASMDTDCESDSGGDHSNTSHNLSHELAIHSLAHANSVLEVSNIITNKKIFGQITGSSDTSVDTVDMFCSNMVTEILEEVQYYDKDEVAGELDCNVIKPSVYQSVEGDNAWSCNGLDYNSSISQTQVSSPIRLPSIIELETKLLQNQNTIKDTSNIVPLFDIGISSSWNTPHVGECATPTVLSSTNGCVNETPNIESNSLTSSQNQIFAKNLPQSKLSKFIESMIYDRLTQMGYAHVMETLTLRVVSNMSHCMEVSDIIVNNFKTHENNKVPRYITYKSKCILLFQNIEGLDVCIFSLYVQEFDHDCPEPNKSRINIAYLDSVEYFRPREMRTIVFHEILVSYLKWCQVRGFQHGYIWACPPQRGDSFIFWCHPSHQRTPSRERLVSWYSTMLNRAISLNICNSDFTNLYQTFFHKYFKRDEVNSRNASKNSYVSKNTQKNTNSNSGGVKRETSGSSVVGLCGMGHEEAKEEDVQGVSVDLWSEKDIASVPICPPVFEGDMWVNDCINRVYKLIQMRAKSNEGCADRNLNQRKCRELLKMLMNKSYSVAFLQPVDPIALSIPDYFQIITHPMDLGTIREKMRSIAYPTMQNFAEDVYLVFANAMKYNPPLHPIHTIAKKLLDEFNESLYDMITERMGSSVLYASDAPIDIKNMSKYLSTYLLQPHPSNNIVSSGVESLCVMPTSLTSVEASNSSMGDIIQRRPVVSFDDNAMEICSSNYETETKYGTSSNMVQEEGEGGEGGADMKECGGNSDSSSMKIEDENVSTFDKESSYFHEDFMQYQEECALGGPMPRGVRRHDSLESLVSCSSSDDPRWAWRPTASSSVDVTAAVVAGTIKSDNNDDDDRSAVKQECDSKDSSVGGFSPYSDNFISNAPLSREETLRNINKARSMPFNTPPELGLKGSCAMMAELSRNVMRLKDDMFIFSFKSKNVSDDTPITVCSNSDDFNESPTNKEKTQVSSESTSSGKGKGKGLALKSYIESTFSNNKTKSTVIESESCISEKSLSILKDIRDDTSDPDQCIMNPFLDSRQTFLEMCQYRHYQFDSLRAAKHSTMMLLYHLYNPHLKSTRVTCVCCQNVISEIRYHCDQCPDYDICGLCHSVTNNVTSEAIFDSSLTQSDDSSTNASCNYIRKKLPHVHQLTPIRVTYV